MVALRKEVDVKELAPNMGDEVKVKNSEADTNSESDENSESDDNSGSDENSGRDENSCDDIEMKEGCEVDDEEKEACEVDAETKVGSNEVDAQVKEGCEVDDEMKGSGDLTKDKNQTLLSHFWNLASLDESVRSESVVNLLTELKKSRREDDLNYTAQRLVKGLSSSRKAARQGFAAALTHVMNEFIEITPDLIFELMAKHLTVQGSFKGQEERDAYFGQIFGYLAVYRSKVQGADSEVDMGLVKKLTEGLLVLMKKKSYLQEICGIAICDILKCINYSSFETIKPMLETTLNKGWEKCSPEDLMIVLTIQSKFGNDLPKKYFKEHWNRSEILHKANFKHMSRVLMDTTNTAHPRVHILWDNILQFLLSSDKEDDTFEKFWKIVIEDGFMHSTHERKFLVMNIILKMASKLPSDKVQTVFGGIIIRCMINSSQSKKNYLYSCVQNMLGKLPERLAENNDKDIIACIVKCLVGCYGHVAFDSITKTKVVDELTSKLTHNLPAYFNWLKDVFLAGTSNLDVETTELPEKDVNECRAWVVNQLILLLRTCKNQNEESLLMEITHFLFFHAYFTALKKSKREILLKCLPACPVSDQIHQFCRQRFNTALTELANFHIKSQGENKSSIGGIEEDGESYAWKILCFAKKLLEMPNYVLLESSWTPEVYESWSHSLEKISTMQCDNDKSEGTVNSKGTQLLFIHATLQLFSNREEAVDILNELETCYEKAEEKKRRKKTEPHWTEVLTEILLGFLAQSSHLMRQVVDMVYPTIVPHLTRDALDLLIKAVEPDKRAGDSGIEFENESDLEMNEDEELKVVNENEGEENEDGENENGVVENGVVDEDEEEDNENDDDPDSDSADSEDSDEGSDFEVDEAFKTELKAALGDSAVNSDAEDSSNEDEEEDIDMDTCDPNMLKAMDQALADVFTSRRQKQIEKKKKKDRKLSILHFKLRVLDLIEIFIKKQHKDANILTLVEPLYEVIKSSHGQANEQPLFERTLGIFKNKLCNLHEYPSGKDLDVDGVHDQIERLFELATTATSALMVTYITQGVIYLIRVLRGNPEIKEPSPRATRSQRKSKSTVKAEHKSSHLGCLNVERVVECYKTALIQFMTKKSSQLQPVLFNELIQRFPSLGWKLATVLPQYLNEGCNNFRKVKAFEMLKLLFSKKTDNYVECLLEVNKMMYLNIIQAFQATREENYSLKARQFHHIVQLADIYIKEISKYPNVCKEVDKDRIKESITEALESPVVTRSTSLQSYCKKCLSSLDNTDKNLQKTPKNKNKQHVI